MTAEDDRVAELEAARDREQRRIEALERQIEAADAAAEAVRTAERERAARPEEPPPPAAAVGRERQIAPEFTAQRRAQLEGALAQFVEARSPLFDASIQGKLVTGVQTFLALPFPRPIDPATRPDGQYNAAEYQALFQSFVKMATKIDGTPDGLDVDYYLPKLAISTPLVGELDGLLKKPNAPLSNDMIRERLAKVADRHKEDVKNVTRPISLAGSKAYSYVRTNAAEIFAFSLAYWNLLATVRLTVPERFGYNYDIDASNVMQRYLKTRYLEMNTPGNQLDKVDPTNLGSGNAWPFTVNRKIGFATWDNSKQSSVRWKPNEDVPSAEQLRSLWQEVESEEHWPPIKGGGGDGGGGINLSERQFRSLTRVPGQPPNQRWDDDYTEFYTTPVYPGKLFAKRLIVRDRWLMREMRRDDLLRWAGLPSLQQQR